MLHPMTSVETKRATFRKLHEQGCFVIPNPWDRGSARYLAHLGFPALATSSAGYAFSQALPDEPTALPRDQVLAHVREIACAADVPVNADFQDGYARDIDALKESVRLCVEAGAAGISIEDATGDPGQPFYPLDIAVARVRAARTAIDSTGCDVLLTARAEQNLIGHPDALAESIRRLKAYAQAGAHVLYAPGLRGRDPMSAVIDAVAPRPVNILIGADVGLRVSDVAALGARRISVGSALARVAWTAFMRAARMIATDGDFGAFADLASTRELSELFAVR